MTSASMPTPPSASARILARRELNARLNCHQRSRTASPPKRSRATASRLAKRSVSREPFS